MKVELLLCILVTPRIRHRYYPINPFVKFDLEDEVWQVKKLSSDVISSLGVPDILVNNAGSLAPGFVVDADYDSWDKMVDVNIRSHLYILGEFLPGMKERGSGHVVNVTSEGERKAAACAAVYCGTKLFWTGMSEAMR